MVSTLNDLSYLHQRVRSIAGMYYISQRKTNLVVWSIAILVLIVEVLLQNSVQIVFMNILITVCVAYVLAFTLAGSLSQYYHKAISNLIRKSDEEIEELEQTHKTDMQFLLKNVPISTTKEGNEYLSEVLERVNYTGRYLLILKEERKYLISLENIGIT